MVGKCSVKTCNSTETNRHWISGHTDHLGKDLTLIVDICQECEQNLRIPGNKVSWDYYRCGGLGFINTITKNKEIKNA